MTRDSVIEQWYLGHEADPGDHLLYLEGDTCTCCGVTFSGRWEMTENQFLVLFIVLGILTTIYG